MENKIEREFAGRLYSARLKQIKKDIGNKCSFLSNYIDSKGSRFVKAIVSKKDHLFEIPYDLTQMKQADYDYLQELIQNKCDE